MKRLVGPLPWSQRHVPPSVLVSWNVLWCLGYAGLLLTCYLDYAPVPPSELRSVTYAKLEARLKAAEPDLTRAFARHWPASDIEPGDDPRPALRRIMASPLAIEAFYVDEDMGFTDLQRSSWEGRTLFLTGHLGSWSRRLAVTASVEPPATGATAARLAAWSRDLGTGPVSWLRNTFMHDQLREALAQMPTTRFTIPSWEAQVRLKPTPHGVIGYFVTDRTSDPALKRDVQAALHAHGLDGILRWPFHVGVPQVSDRQHVYGVVDAGPVEREVDLEAAGLLGLLALLLLAKLLGAVEALREMWAERSVALAQSNFVAAVSHEMRTPLTTIQLYAEMLEADVVTDPARRRHYLRTIRQEGERLGRLVENVLDYANISGQRKAYRMEPLEARALVEEALAAVAGPLERAGMVAELHAPVPVMTTGDRDALVQSVVNLLGNAVKYGAQGKRVVVSVVPQARGVSIDVEDFGPGIAPTEQKKVFKPFYRVGNELTRTTTGSGLGLALVQETAIAHRGRVELVSHPGRGSVFRLVLPGQEGEG